MFKNMSEIVTLHEQDDFEKMRKAGHLAASVLDFIQPYVKPGITTDELNVLCHEKICDCNAIPAPLNYRGFPKSICTSVNDVVCHGIPSSASLRDGDIINIDTTVILDGWHGDSSRMYWVGSPSIKAKRLTEATYKSLLAGIEAVKPGGFISDIGKAIEKCINDYGYSIVREFCAHGLGKEFHCAPNIVHFAEDIPRSQDIEMKPGMFFTIEPMINTGKQHVKLSKKDGWTVTTKDMSLSAQFEHSLAVTEDGYEIFTHSPAGIYYPTE